MFTASGLYQISIHWYLRYLFITIEKKSVKVGKYCGFRSFLLRFVTGSAPPPVRTRRGCPWCRRGRQTPGRPGWRWRPRQWWPPRWWRGGGRGGACPAPPPTAPGSPGGCSASGPRTSGCSSHAVLHTVTQYITTGMGRKITNQQPQSKTLFFNHKCPSRNVFIIDNSLPSLLKNTHKKHHLAVWDIFNNLTSLKNVYPFLKILQRSKTNDKK